MPLTYEQIELIKNVFGDCNKNIKKETITERLKHIKENTENKELNSIIEDTVQKLKIMSDIEVENLLGRICSNELII